MAIKLTNALLKKMISEEVAKFGDMESTEKRAKDTKEVDAEDLGDEKVLAKKIDFMKALKIEESRLRRRLAKIQEARKNLIPRK